MTHIKCRIHRPAFDVRHTVTHTYIIQGFEILFIQFQAQFSTEKYDLTTKIKIKSPSTNFMYGISHDTMTNAVYSATKWQLKLNHWHSYPIWWVSEKYMINHIKSCSLGLCTHMWHSFVSNSEYSTHKLQHRLNQQLLGFKWWGSGEYMENHGKSCSSHIPKYGSPFPSGKVLFGNLYYEIKYSTAPWCQTVEPMWVHLKSPKI